MSNTPKTDATLASLIRLGIKMGFSEALLHEFAKDSRLIERELSKKEEWRPIATAPKDGSRILAFWRNNDAISTIYRDNGQWTDAGNGDEYIIDPTHWMHLPNPPGKPSHQEK